MKKNIEAFDLSEFSVPPGFRGRNKVVVQLWWLVECTLFRLSPQIFYKWRVRLLRIFGAEIGEGVLIRPTVKVTYPWKVRIGKNSWVGDNVTLYSLGEINIGSNTIVSQGCYLCTGSHDYQSKKFEIYSKPISIGDSTWLASDVFVAPGVNIGSRVVVGARSSIFKDLADQVVCRNATSLAVKPRD